MTIAQQARAEQDFDMRLICPNCSAQYEIDATLIPEKGRDVQCSNCGNTWYQRREVEKALTPEPDWDAIADADQDDDDEIVEPAADQPDWRESEPDVDDAPLAEPEPEPVTSDSARRRVDRDALDILKEEADREMAVRQGQPPIEVQSDFGDATETVNEGPSRAYRERISRIEYADDRASGETEAAAIAAATAHARRPKSDLLPEIEEISSSLRSSRERGEDGGDRASFRYGFAASFGLAFLLLVAYVYAPELAAAIPAAEPFLISYVDAANGVRDGIDAMFGS